MTENIVNIGKTTFCGFDVIPVSQKNQLFYLGRIPARFLLNAYTVVPAEYDVDKAASLAESYKNDTDYAEFRLDMDRKESEIDTKSFERKLDMDRVKEITRFLNDDDYALFPNTIIVMCDLLNDNIDVPPGTQLRDIADSIGQIKENLSFLETSALTPQKSMLYIPDGKNSLLIIDGQHRIKGLENANPNVRDNYDVLVSFIAGFDRAVVAKIFYTVNYTQKPVNKSLLYHLMGEFSHNLDKRTFLHEVVRVLNEVTSSALYKRVKMLGTVDSTATVETQKKMTISQAFLIDYLVRSIDSKAKTGIYPPIFLRFYQIEDFRVDIIHFIMNYFEAISELKRVDWDSPEQSIICKTIGIGAFIRVMYFLFVKIVTKDPDYNMVNIRNITKDNLKDLLNGIQTIDFSTTGPYGKAASGGTLNKLKEEIIEKSACFKGLKYEDFISDYKANDLKKFRDWLNTKGTK